MGRHQGLARGLVEDGLAAGRGRVVVEPVAGASRGHPFGDGGLCPLCDPSAPELDEDGGQERVSGADQARP